MKVKFIISFFFIILSISSQEINPDYYITQAKKIEKSSVLFSIPLYEKALEMELSQKEKSFIIGKLFDLYLNYSKIEEIFILTKNHEIDKSREIKLNHLYKTLAHNINMQEEKFKDFIECLLSKDYHSQKKLLNYYAEERSIYVLNYIFAIKYKLQDFESLGYLISEAPDMPPSLRLAYLIKTNSKETEKKIKEFAKISELTDDQRMEILFLYGAYLQKKRRYKQSARYFRMSASFDKKNTNFAKMGIVEAAKSLFINGKGQEGCELLEGKKIQVQTESDELLNLYCNKKIQKDLNKYLPAIEVLAKQESGVIFRSYLQLYLDKESYNPINYEDNF